jgi:hypothetical protein
MLEKLEHIYRRIQKKDEVCVFGINHVLSYILLPSQHIRHLIIFRGGLGKYCIYLYNIILQVKFFDQKRNF